VRNPHCSGWDLFYKSRLWIEVAIQWQQRSQRASVVVHGSRGAGGLERSSALSPIVGFVIAAYGQCNLSLLRSASRLLCSVSLGFGVVLSTVRAEHNASWARGRIQAPDRRPAGARRRSQASRAEGGDRTPEIRNAPDTLRQAAAEGGDHDPEFWKAPSKIYK
jgi:hypothetical protein